MLEFPEIQKLLRQVADGILDSNELLEVRTEASVDADGEDALRITLIITDAAAKSLDGEQLSQLLTDLHDTLLTKGEERFPVLHFSTPSDPADMEQTEDLID